MSTSKIVVRIAAFAGLLLLAGVRAEASGCCGQDCTDAYGTMLNSGVPAGDASKWYRECLQACQDHGDPTTCPKEENMAAGNGMDAIPDAETDLCEIAPHRDAEPDHPILVPAVTGQHPFLPIPFR